MVRMFREFGENKAACSPGDPVTVLQCHSWLFMDQTSNSPILRYAVSMSSESGLHSICFIKSNNYKSARNVKLRTSHHYLNILNRMKRIALSALHDGINSCSLAIT